MRNPYSSAPQVVNTARNYRFCASRAAHSGAGSCWLALETGNDNSQPSESAAAWDSEQAGLWRLNFNVCLYVRPGLLLICMLASEVWDAETKPIEFVCNKGARRAMNIVAERESVLHQEKRGDIVASLSLLIEGVKVVKSPSQPECAASLLQRLENNINNYLLILTHLQLSGPVGSPALSCVPRSTQSLSTILINYNQLILGKLERFMINLEDRCISQ
ncbi:thrombopoietin [Perca flavescens]|uniref:thrombopoietin n=1 Tax=Perca flavescens TaxID=8167 RepID=UPI00106EA4B7|nr:uncharacterized protein LOC114565937 [Perca flavescens]